MSLNRKQRDHTAKLLLDITKYITTVYIVGALLSDISSDKATPGVYFNVTVGNVLLVIMLAIIVYGVAMKLLEGDDENNERQNL